MTLKPAADAAREWYKEYRKDLRHQPTTEQIVSAAWSDSRREMANEIKALLDEIEALRKERDDAVDALCKWRSAFQECTPGGSEFMSVESVREYMQHIKRETVQAKLSLARAKKERDAEAENCRLMQDRLSRLLGASRL